MEHKDCPPLDLSLKKNICISFVYFSVIILFSPWYYTCCFRWQGWWLRCGKIRLFTENRQK